MDETMLGGRYRRVRPLGRGAMGEVWLAEDTLLHRNVAIKSVAHAEPSDLNRGVREARLAAQLNHPNAVAVYDVVLVDEQPFVVMEYVAGQSLAELIASTPMDPAEVGRIGIAVAEALGEAHEIGLVHRDIKPANIMITTRGTPKIADFGIARLAADAERTSTGVTIGTPAYLAPELARGGTADPRSDIWALGITLYAALDEGRSPFQQAGDNAFSVIARLAADPVPPPPRRGGALSGTVLRMLAPDPEHRPSAMDVVEMLRGDLAAGHETRPWSLPPYALAPPMPPVPPASPLDPFSPGAQAPSPDPMPVPPMPFAPEPAAAMPVHPPITETPRDPLSLFGDDRDDDGWEADTGPVAPVGGGYGAAQHYPPRGGRRRGLLVAAVVVLALAAGAITTVVLLDRKSSSSAGPSRSVSTSPSAVSTSPSAPPPTTTPTGTAYTGPGGITVFAPVGWRNDTTAGIANVRDYVAPGSGKRIQSTFFRVGIGNPNPKPSFDDQVQEEIDYLTGSTNSYDNVQFVQDPKRLTYLGSPAADFEYTGDLKSLDSGDAGFHRHVKLRIWTSGGVQREIVLIAVASQWDTYAALFDQLVASARTS